MQGPLAAALPRRRKPEPSRSVRKVIGIYSSLLKDDKGRGGHAGYQVRQGCVRHGTM